MKQLILKKKKLEYTGKGTRCVIRVSPETYNTLVDLANLTGMPISENCVKPDRVRC